jgi:peptidoglycan/xylan/chitin deacetylase (PgdA/CDA1 family)
MKKTSKMRFGMFFLVITLFLQILGATTSRKETNNVYAAAADQPTEIAIPWTFLTYPIPDFRADITGYFYAQTVNVIQTNDEGWALISTFNGEQWVYPSANMRYVDRWTYLYDNILGNTVARIDPQVVEVLAQDGNWLQIQTWLGSRWIYLRTGRALDGKLVALTFDDGPGAYTNRLLDTLYARNVPATFFVLGQQVSANPAVAKRMVEEGHEIASHSYRHPNFTSMSASGIRDELNQSRNAILQATGAVPALLRPPYGSYNSTVQSVAIELGLPLIMWSVDTRDWESRNVNSILGHFTDGNRIKIKDGDIILMHDIYSTTVDAAIRAVDLLLADGFTFVTVSELLMERYKTVTPGRVYYR